MTQQAATWKADPSSICAASVQHLFESKRGKPGGISRTGPGLAWK
jgi:hypothetical protein